MKQLIISLALLTVSLSTTAQIKSFSTKHVDADEFLDTPTCDFIYCDNFTLIKDGNGKYDAYIKIDNDIVEEEHVTIRIGIYAANDSLIYKKDWECKSLNDFRTLMLYDGSNTYTHLQKHTKQPETCNCSEVNFPLSYIWQIITEGPGYIRFHIPTISGAMDFKAYTIPLYDYIMQKE